MKDNLIVMRTLHGSHLYGTSTEKSDHDFKSVHIPGGRNILLQRCPDVLSYSVKVSETLKNSKEDTDDQSFSLQKFLALCEAGDTNSVELLFAPDNMLTATSDLWDELRANRLRLLNAKCKGFVGYCKRQAAKYGIKGSRIDAVKSTIDLIDSFIAMVGPKTKLGHFYIMLEKHVDNKEFMAIKYLPTPSGKDIGHLEVCGAMAPFTITLDAARIIFDRIYQNYGERARLAQTNQGIDWKAVSHAVRVGTSAIELLGTGFVTFPRPDADYLLKVKLGELPYNEVGERLEGLLEEVEIVSQNSILAPDSDKAYMDELVLKYHREQV